MGVYLRGREGELIGEGDGSVDWRGEGGLI